ncbi:hypothetical protein CC85DRAFT_302819 [Cutaneotrichosporon oleaginosum]|uniref:Magnesium transporter n=1 Tax=Cutaneotrichosporon oleaginosum TaxID=879819 RepID=A0A0J0XLH7_9TREE|nr:uncharacterized protein CC85DRAFT_302819 [Cutaneotrichosporon oleaginosum]KLT41942.1 hypothetical protein CC85DRAFT_302819 [Cutaneotrichosporon oleaginosum]
MLASALVALASIALLHAAFSAYEYLSALKALGQPGASLPTSIIAEALVSLVIFIPAITLAYPALQDVTFRGELAKRTPDDMDARMGFMRLSARGAALFGDRA